MRFGQNCPLSSVELYHTDQELFQLRTGSVQQATLVRFELPADVHTLLWVCKGTVLLRRGLKGRWSVLAPASVGLVSGPAPVALSLARGEHKMYVMAWHGESTAALHRWIQKERRSAKTGDVLHGVFSTPFQHVREADLDRLAADARRGADWVLPVMFSYAHCGVGECVKSEDAVGLTPLPSDLPPMLVALIDRVKEHPEHPWPLKEGADFVGYSPFHFSRVFKSLVGYGFHEFVDRCRTELAVRKLTSTEEPVDSIATSCGFGTAQGLRESIKEYLGLLPSELRAEQG
ncbi:MAG: AraC family transcriptional regulator [Fimbriimonadales bacterium]|nr:AraC family transcriptional regulator [Fimbriimonadales bacterium]